ncbi:MAG: hypothetical protein Q7J09_07070 [Methanocalculus sp.]|uniref:hypothetical protein n=1 Tax=Methanocalculus sp. TaxID=2004547 RepID=UPI002717D782|nr:hypothetical protein [Methanocalculus sp.]MDO9539744.1 hypothetical protein [Methanocalculus sp.]
MSQTIEVDRECALCGISSRQFFLLESDARGSPDLDLRPPESLRSTIYSWIQHCPSCGYCSTDIGHVSEGVDAIVRSHEYRAQLNDPSLPLLARRFLCWSLILKRQDYNVKAGWANLHAAWVCDDAGDPLSASICRQQAFHSFSEAKRSNVRFAEGDQMEETILADLLRRSDLCDEALAICKTTRSPSPELTYEQYLASIHDQNAHRLHEARQGTLKPLQ